MSRSGSSLHNIAVSILTEFHLCCLICESSNLSSLLYTGIHYWGPMNLETMKKTLSDSEPVMEARISKLSVSVWLLTSSSAVKMILPLFLPFSLRLTRGFFNYWFLAVTTSWSRNSNSPMKSWASKLFWSLKSSTSYIAILNFCLSSNLYSTWKPLMKRGLRESFTTSLLPISIHLLVLQSIFFNQNLTSPVVNRRHTLRHS